MVSKNTRWTPENIKATAALYETLKAFRKGNPKAYAAAHRHKVLEEVTEHMIVKEPRWNTQAVTDIALTYKTRGQFSQESPGAYTFARRTGILEKICAHMPANVTKDRTKWTRGTLFAEAAKYPSKSDFRKKSRSAYVTAARLGLLDEIYVDA